MGYTHSGALLGLRKGEPGLCDRVAEPGGRCVNCNQAGAETQLAHLPHAWNLKRGSFSKQGVEWWLPEAKAGGERHRELGRFWSKDTKFQF